MDRNNLKLVIALSRSYNALFGQVEKRLKTYDLSLSEFGVLELLHHKGRQPVQQIAEKILVTSGTITYILDKLSQKNLVSREKCSEDGRKYYVDLTKEGKELITDLFPKHERHLEKMFKDIDEVTKANLIENLFKLKDSIEESEK